MNQERKVGLTLVIAALAVALLLIALMSTQANRGLRYTLTFEEAKGLKKGDLVQLQGVEIGVVEWVNLHSNPTKVYVRVKIKPDHAKKVRADSTAIIQNISFPNVSGQMVVNVINSKAEPQAPPMPEDQIAYGLSGLFDLKKWELKQNFRGSTDLLKRHMRQLNERADRLGDNLKELDIPSKIGVAFSSLHGFLKKMKVEGVAALDRLEREWPLIKEQVMAVLKDLKIFGQDSQLVQQILQMMDEIEQILAQWRLSTQEEPNAEPAPQDKTETDPSG